MLTVTVVVSAHNAERCLSTTLESLRSQTEPADEIVVVDDGSSDRTAEVAAAYGVRVIRPRRRLGSKAKAQNYVLPLCRTDLVLAVDADTVLAVDYIENVKPAFDSLDVVVAAGRVQSRFERGWSDHGRVLEYLYGFHWNRQMQNLANSPMVCSDYCSMYRREHLVGFGGFSDRTVAADMDYTWSVQTEGWRAVHVAAAVAWVEESGELTHVRMRDWRWMVGFFQNVRIHFPEMTRRRPMLAAWILLSLVEIIIAPLWLAWPIHRIGLDGPVWQGIAWWCGAEIALTLPPLLYVFGQRRVPLRRMLRALPRAYVMKMVNLYFAWKTLVVELLLVPLDVLRPVPPVATAGRVMDKRSWRPVAQESWQRRLK